MDRIDKLLASTDVTREYLDTAAPGQGTVTYDEDYKVGNHRSEIAIAQWVHTVFGGDIHLLNERGYTQVSPDYRWRGKLWELKEPSTETSTDNAVKKALKQIYEHPGGIILNYRENEITHQILEAVRRRVERSGFTLVDVIFLQKGALVRILRYKK